MNSTTSITTSITISAASRADYARFAPIHYRSGSPATIARVLRASIDATPVGVLVTSFPTPNANWRAVAWPDLYAQGVPSLRTINAEIRTISRVITDPRYRGMGIASALVGAYLAEPDTPRTETLASWPGAQHLFAAMRPVARPDPLQLVAIRAALASLSIPAWRALDLRIARQLVGLAGVRAAVLRWAGASRATRHMTLHTRGSTPAARMALALLLSKAAAQLLHQPRAFVTP
jgi:GNAT superfamily N-acetyltransferase